MDNSLAQFAVLSTPPPEDVTRTYGGKTSSVWKIQYLQDPEMMHPSVPH